MKGRSRRLERVAAQAFSDVGRALCSVRAGWWIALATCLLTALFGHAFLEQSRLIDGVRHFWLDDDQMISMRYGRNLAEGHGLVWNSGERVEGYSNFAWTLVMAAVHAVGAGDAVAAAVMKVVAWLITVLQLLLAVRLMRVFARGPALAVGAMACSLAVCLDFVYWPANGFETALLGGIWLGALVVFLEGRQGAGASCPGRGLPLTCLLLSLLPLVRADGGHLWLAGAVVVLGLSADRRRAATLIALSALPAVAHLAFRQAFYGEWLPNTYFLKVDHTSRGLLEGLYYVRRIAWMYGPVVTVAILGAVVDRCRQRAFLLAAVAMTVAFCMVVGGDGFHGARFFAPHVPLVYALGFAAAARLVPAHGWRLPAACVGLAAVVSLGAGVTEPRRMISGNGNPAASVIAGATLAKNASRDASVAVIAAGNVPYFSRLRAVDLLGVCDPELSRRPGHPGSPRGHGKYDAAASLARRPDFIVGLVPHAVFAKIGMLDERLAKRFHPRHRHFLLAEPAFATRYLPHPVAIPDLLKGTPVYVLADSAELRRLATWTPVGVAR